MSYGLNLEYRTSNGYSTSIAGENIIKTLMPEYTAPAVKTFSLWVESDAKIIINKDGRERTVTSRLGMNYSDEFEEVETLEFVESGINYFIAYGV